MLTGAYEILAFLIFTLFCLYLPGKYLINRLKLELNSPEDLFFPFGLGLLVFILLSYILLWLKLPFFLIPIFLIFDYIIIHQGKWRPEKLNKKHFLPIAFVVILAIAFSLPMVIMGIYGNHLSYAHDDLWHLALINELKSTFPPQNPGFAGVQLNGYHFFYNLLIAQISNNFLISPLALHFHLFPVLIALLWGTGVYTLVFRWSKNILTSILAVFLTMFGGSFSFMLLLQGHPGFSLDAAYGIGQPGSSLYNPPFALSIIFMITSLFSLYCYIFKKQDSWLAPLVLGAGLMAMTKIYGAIVLTSGLVAFSMVELFKKKFIIIVALLGITLIFLTTYWPFVGNSGYLIFYPFWRPHEVLRNLPWIGYEQRLYDYSKQHILHGIIKAELYGIYLFFIGNLGTRVIGLLALPVIFIKQRHQPHIFSQVIFFMLIISIFIPLLFIQSGKVFEIIQVAAYYLFFASIFSAFGLTYLLKLKFKLGTVVKILFIILFVIATLPSASETYKNFYKYFKERSSLKEPYFQTMIFLKNQGSYNQTVLEIPSGNITSDLDDKVLRNWYNLDSSPKVTAFGNKRSYLANVYFESPQDNVDSRLVIIKKIIAFGTNISKIKIPDQQKEIELLLAANKISFIYSPYPLPNLELLKTVDKIYQNQSETIYKIN